MGDEVNSFGRAAGEDDFLRTGRAEISGDTFPGTFVGLGRARTEFVQAAVDIGVLVFVIIPQGVEHLSRLLGGRRVVEIDEGMIVRPLQQDRKIIPDRAPIHLRARKFVHGF